MSRPRLFISYSHQPPEHSADVRKFIEQVQSDEQPVDLHHDGVVEGPRRQPEGWTHWMRSQVEAADWVLVVCNQPYLESWRKSPTAGRGVAYEAALLLQGLYEKRMVNHKLIPVVFTAKAKEFIPIELRDATNYTLPADWNQLRQRILKSTWLGRFLDASAPDPLGSTVPLSASEVMDDADEFEDLTDDLPALKTLRDDLIAEANQFIEDLNKASNALKRVAVRNAFQHRFCPRAKELFGLLGSLPKSLEVIFNRECDG